REYLVNIVADESVDRPIVERLRHFGHQVYAIVEWEPSITDEVVLQRANEAGALLLTADKDFGEMVFRQGSVALGIILIRLAGLSPERKASITAAAIEEHGVAMRSAF